MCSHVSIYVTDSELVSIPARCHHHLVPILYAESGYMPNSKNKTKKCIIVVTVAGLFLLRPQNKTTKEQKISLFVPIDNIECITKEDENQKRRNVVTKTGETTYFISEHCDDAVTMLVSACKLLCQEDIELNYRRPTLISNLVRPEDVEAVNYVCECMKSSTPPNGTVIEKLMNSGNDPIRAYYSKNRYLKIYSSIHEFKRSDGHLQGLQSVFIPASCRIIPNSCFEANAFLQYCVLSCVTFEKGSILQKIGSYAFAHCRYLKEIEIPASVEEIGHAVFFDCGVTRVTFSGESNFIVIGSYIVHRSDMRLVTCFDNDEIEIPASVKEIGEYCFRQYDYPEISVFRVTFASGSVLKSIGNEAFYWCKHLRAIEIPASVENIGNGCFCESSRLSRVTFASGSVLKCIGNDVFSGLKRLREIDIPASVEEIGKQCFYYCKSLSCVRFGHGSVLKRIGERSFGGCDKLEEIEIPVSVEEIGGGVLSKSTMTRTTFSGENRIFIIDQFLVCRRDMRIVSSLGGENNIEIPAKIEKIDKQCFCECSASRITFRGESILKCIGNEAFSSVWKIQEIEIPASVEEIGDGCFNYSSLSRVTFGSKSCLKRIGNNAFQHCRQLREIEIPASVEEIGRNCFEECSSMSQVTFGGKSCLKRIGKWAFDNCKHLREIEIPASVEEIDSGALRLCKHLSRVTFGSKSCLKRIGNRVFDDCSDLREIDIPASVEEIGNECFDGCSSLSRVTFAHESVLKFIGKKVFSDCNELREIELPTSVEEISWECFSDSSISNVRFAGDCKNFTLIDQMIVRKHGMCVVCVLPDADAIKIPANVEEIGKKCFCECSASRITFRGESILKCIGNEAFRSCEIQEIEIPASVEEIGDGCFNYSSLSRVTFGSKSCLKRIGNNVFGNCCQLREIEIPASVEEIGRNCFDECSSMYQVTFGGKSCLKRIGEWAFHNCKELREIEIPASVEEIGLACFCECSSLSHVIFACGSVLKRTGWRVFRNTQVSTVSLPIDRKHSLMELLFTEGSGLTSETVKIIDMIPKEPETLLSDFVFEIDDYDRVKKLGSGGFGKVYLYQKGDSFIAAKFISESECGQESFTREIEILKSASNPFIVGFRGFELPSPQTRYKFVIGMEYIPGPSLNDVIGNPPSWLDNNSKIKIICGIALGMQYLHLKDIIHRDLKPANVLIDESHLPRICDFGSSRLFTTDSTLTTRPSFTPVYAAPELYDGIYSMKVDVYSFGIILYEIVTGNFAFRNLSELQLVKHIAFGKREQIPDSVTPFVKDLIEKCWEHDPKLRPSFADICVSLKQNLHKIFDKSDASSIREFQEKYFR